ncbi:MAG TPA: DUF5946 family protein [Anaerolineae bacterium]|nr:DUF5946 family protein [Anaerolineae bacterium]HMR66530.1 DUF5946 family protein [Anaerolineae bacterium]
MTELHDSPRTSCPECGAPQVAGLTCWEQLGAIIAWEAQDPELQAEHFLTVAAYNLQHPAQFTDEALAGLQTALIDRLDKGVAVEVLRRRAAAAFEGKKRVLKKEVERRPVLRPWPMTIADVYRPDQPEGAAERVRRWAAGIRSELGNLTQLKRGNCSGMSFRRSEATSPR